MYNDGLLEKCEEIAVIGFGATGQAVANFLQSQDVKVFVTEENRINSEIKKDFQQKGVAFEEGGHSKRVLDSDLVVLSPGVPPDTHMVQEVRQHGIPTIGEIELAYRFSPTKRIIAVTGTNGKSTTVNLITEILEYAGTNPVACGNIGTPFISMVPSLAQTDVAVVEVSSYQLETTRSFKPNVAVLTNLDPDHLGRHGSFEKYREIKLRLFNNQDEDDCAIVPGEFAGKISNKKPTRIAFEPRKPRGAKLSPHQQENVGAALAAVNWLLGDKGFDEPPFEPVSKGLRLPHRLESVREINKVEFIDDSKATNPAATIAAINGIKQPIRLLLGGKAKTSGYNDLVKRLESSSVIFTYLFGSARDKLSEIFRNHNSVDFDTCPSLEEAIKSAFTDASRGEAILLSPGCSSFDRFDNFEERGKRFKEIVNSLAN